MWGDLTVGSSAVSLTCSAKKLRANFNCTSLQGKPTAPKQSIWNQTGKQNMQTGLTALFVLVIFQVGSWDFALDGGGLWTVIFPSLPLE
jgi:hypothetical protein